MSDVSESQQAAMWAEAEWEAREPELIPSEPEPERKPRLKPVNRNQLRLRTVEVEKLVEANHLVRAIWELVGRLDLKGFTAEIAAVDGVAGRSAFDPRLLISLWLYADSEGVGSAHEVERRCAYPPAYQGLTGMEAVNYHPSADGSDFRVQYQEALDELFAQRLGVLSSEGLISLERVVHDGTKVKASASGKSFHREKTLRAHLEAARAEKSERRVSESDPEARLMKQSDGGYAPSHNVQISTDTAHGIIVGASVTQAANDQEQRVPAMEEIERQTGRRPEHLVVDDGYTTRENVLAAAEKGVDLIGGMMEPDAEASPRRLKQRGVDPAFYAENFRDNPATNTYACPAGKALPYQTPKHDRVGVERKVYKARAADCRDCGFRPPCRPGAQGRRIVRSENVPVVA
jgi:transposase